MTAQKARRDPSPGRPRPRSERGAVLVQVAIAFIGLTAFGSFIVDYGVLWTARRQAQNAADAGAMAAAASFGLNGGDEARARSAAIEAARVNLVWGEPPEVTATDVDFDTCPAGSPEAGGGQCVRVDVFRNQERGNPLPTILGTLVGIDEQGVRATATAEVLYSNTTSCVKPLAILDRWLEGVTSLLSFDKYVLPLALPPTLLPNPDSYVPDTAGSIGSGFDLQVDYGLELNLTRRIGPPTPLDTLDWYIPLDLACAGSLPGSAACVIENLTSCSPQTIGPDLVVQLQVAGLSPLGVDLLAPALASLIDADPSADWDDGANGGRGGVVGGCMADGSCNVSPRIIAVPLINPEIWADQNANTLGLATSVTVTRVAGMFVDQVSGHQIVGRLMPFVAPPSATNLGLAGSSFVVSTILVR